MKITCPACGELTGLTRMCSSCGASIPAGLLGKAKAKAEAEAEAEAERLEEERILKERQAKEYSEQLSKARDRIAKYQRCISVYVGLKTDGTVVAAGYNNQGQCNVSGWRDIVAVATNYFCTIGLKADGTVVAAGDNEDGECNVSDWCDIGPVPEEQKKSMRWHAQGLCKYCGGELKGFFSKKCTSCGKTN